MLSSSEKMVHNIPPISPTTNQWPQSDVMASSGTRVMEKPAAGPPPPPPQEVMKCPRCDSSNTKFCYYNNYSLSQPRHFCKACKRYWTRGGTLRNVPVGGGYRRSINSNNKRGAIKQRTNPSSHDLTSSSQPQIIDAASIGALSANCDVNLIPFTSRFNSTTISSSSGYDHILQPQMNSLGLGHLNSDRNGPTSYYDSIFGSNSSNYRSTSNSTHPVMPNSLFMNYCGVKDGPGSSNVTFQGLAPQMVTNISGEALKDVKVEAAAAGAGQNQMMMEHVGLYDSSLYYNWNTPTAMVGVWKDQPSNIGPSSVTPLI